ncbi:MAG: putative branched-subunit amino acid permease [Gammaproteobacteria bacterium]|jgi:predicted branched-subunit amino acid permease
MSTFQSFKLGIRCSGGYFISTFLFGVMFGIAAVSAGIEQWQSLLMSASVFSASAQFVSLEFWLSPLPLGTIALSVALVSSRNILLGMSMTYHFDGHSLLRRIVWLFLLNDPGVVTALRLDKQVDRLGYVFGYGVSLLVSWVLSTWVGLNLAEWFAGANLGSLNFAGPMVMATMMILFVKGSGANALPWITSGLASLMLYELGSPNYLILLGSVSFGIVVAVVHERTKHV